MNLPDTSNWPEFSKIPFERKANCTTNGDFLPTKVRGVAVVPLKSERCGGCADNFDTDGPREFYVSCNDLPSCGTKNGAVVWAPLTEESWAQYVAERLE